MLYGYSSRTDPTPPESLTSIKQRFSVCSWLYMGNSASDTGSDEFMR